MSIRSPRRWGGSIRLRLFVGYRRLLGWRFVPSDPTALLKNAPVTRFCSLIICVRNQTSRSSSAMFCTSSAKAKAVSDSPVLSIKLRYLTKRARSRLSVFVSLATECESFVTVALCVGDVVL
jgi:hypothetical protein